MGVTVHAPVEGFTGTVAGVAFADGAATNVTNPAALAYFRRHGYQVERPEGDQRPAPAAPPARPRVNDPRADWDVYALALGFTDEQVKAWSKRELIDATADVPDNGGEG